MQQKSLSASEAAELAAKRFGITPSKRAVNSARNFTPEEINREVDFLRQKISDPSGYEKYKRLAGEVEARNVQSRLNLSPDDRRMLPPWKTEDVPLDQQIVRFGDGPAMSDVSYRGQHTAPGPDYGDSIDSLGNLVPEDWYDSATSWRYYGHGGNAVGMDKETANIIAGMKGKPDAEISIYRAVPKGVKDINPGDWVTVNKNYAKQHGSSWVDDGSYEIIEKKVKAKDIFTDGNSIHEWGYNP
jgi:hypothetical protein